MSIPVPTELIPLLTQIPFVAVLIWFVIHRDGTFHDERKQTREEFRAEREQWRQDIKSLGDEWRVDLKNVQDDWRADFRTMQKEWRDEMRSLHEQFLQNASANREVLNHLLNTMQRLTAPEQLAGEIARRMENPNRNRGRRREDRQEDE